MIVTTAPQTAGFERTGIASKVDRGANEPASNAAGTTANKGKRFQSRGGRKETPPARTAPGAKSIREAKGRRPKREIPDD